MPVVKYLVPRDGAKGGMEVVIRETPHFGLQEPPTELRVWRASVGLDG